MQKFTRPLTREVECGGERLALTLSEQGIAIRTVGSRRAPAEVSWSRLLCYVTSHHALASAAPTAEELAAAVQHLRNAPTAPKSTTAPTEPSPSPEPVADATPAPVDAPSAPRISAPKRVAAEAEHTASPLARLEIWLAHHRPRYLHGLERGASAAELDALQTELGRPLPAALRMLLAWHNGQKDQTAGAFEQSWRLMNTRTIATAKKELDGALAGNPSGGWHRDWVPILENENGDFLVADTSRPETPVRAYYLGSDERPLVADSLSGWVQNLVAAVERGEYHEDPERGDFLRAT